MKKICKKEQLGEPSLQLCDVSTLYEKEKVSETYTMNRDARARKRPAADTSLSSQRPSLHAVHNISKDARFGRDVLGLLENTSGNKFSTSCAAGGAAARKADCSNR
jgi:hypothetical protein